MKNNTVERAITPYNPSQSEVHQKDRYNLYAPLVRRNQPGIAQFNPNDFRISDGVVSAQIKNVGAIQYSGTPINISEFNITWNINSISAKLVKDAVPGDLILALTNDERNGDIYQIISIVDDEILSLSTRIGTLLGPQGFDALTYSEIYYSTSAVNTGLVIIQEVAKFNRTAVIGDDCIIVCSDMTTSPFTTYITTCKVTNVSDTFVTLSVIKAQNIIGTQGDSATIEIGTVTTGEAGTPAAVENVGTENAAVLNFTIPRGEKGEKGDVGPSGVDEGAVHFNETQNLSDSQKQKAQENIGINPILEQLEDGTYNLVIGVTGDAPSAAAISQINGEDLAGKEFYEYVRTEGAVLFSFNPDFSPAALYGGSWEKITDRFPIGAGGSYSLGSTGGAEDVMIARENIPTLIISSDTMSYNGKHVILCEHTINNGENPGVFPANGWTVSSGSNPGRLGSFGWNNPSQTKLNILPPYIAVNIWRRVA